MDSSERRASALRDTVFADGDTLGYGFANECTSRIWAVAQKRREAPAETQAQMPVERDLISCDWREDDPFKPPNEICTS